MTFQAEVVVALDEHFIGNRAVRLMTNRAAFAQSFVLIDHGACLLTVTLGARFVQPRDSGGGAHAERRAVRRFHNVCAMRIMALHAIHAAFNDRMVLRIFELCVNVDMTGKARLRIAPGIHNEFAAPAAGLHVQTPGTMTGLAACGIAVGRTLQMQAGMWTRSKGARELGMAIDTGLIADERRAFDLRRIDRAARKS